MVCVYVCVCVCVCACVRACVSVDNFQLMLHSSTKDVLTRSMIITIHPISIFHF